MGKIKIQNDTLFGVISHFSFPDSDAIFISTYRSYDSSYIYFSSFDRGKNWEYLSKTKDKDYEGFYLISFINRNIGWGTCNQEIIKDKSYYHVFLYKTTDGGKHWNMQYVDIDIISLAASSITYYDSLHLAFISMDHVYYTSNGGLIWRKYNTTFYNRRTPYINDGLNFPVKDKPIYTNGPLIIQYKGCLTNINEQISYDTLPNNYIVNDMLLLNNLDNYENALVEIYSIYSQKIFVCDNKNIIDISHLSSGLYFLRTKNKIYKFIKL